MWSSMPQIHLDGLVCSTQGMVDLTGIYRIWNPKYKSYSVFSQDHLCRVLLGFDTSGSTHDAVRPLLNMLNDKVCTSLPVGLARILRVQLMGKRQQAEKGEMVTSTCRLTEWFLAAAVQAGDAVKSMRLFRQYHSYHGDPASWTAAQVGDKPFGSMIASYNVHCQPYQGSKGMQAAIIMQCEVIQTSSHVSELPAGSSWAKT